MTKIKLPLSVTSTHLLICNNLSVVISKKVVLESCTINLNNSHLKGMGLWKILIFTCLRVFEFLLFYSEPQEQNSKELKNGDSLKIVLTIKSI